MSSLFFVFVLVLPVEEVLIETRVGGLCYGGVAGAVNNKPDTMHHYSTP